TESHLRLLQLALHPAEPLSVLSPPASELRLAPALRPAGRPGLEPDRDDAGGPAAAAPRLEPGGARRRLSRPRRPARMRADSRSLPVLLLERLAAVRQPLHPGLRALPHGRVRAQERYPGGMVAPALRPARVPQHRDQRLGRLVVADAPLA